jgi:peptidoglycan hydrolase CwlO-like protein
MLIKYQEVHSTLTKNTEREINFIDNQHTSLKSQINQLQKEILTISENRALTAKNINQRQHEVSQSKQGIKNLKSRREYLELQIKELERLLSTVRPGR